MPILVNDSWLKQYFRNFDCPETTLIPTDDLDCYVLYPVFRWVYNKLLICEKQDLCHAPHGIEPPAFPVFSKPIYNLRGMGVGSRFILTKEDYDLRQQPGHLWMVLLQGEHVSSDVAVVDGQAQQWFHVVGKLGEKNGTFDYWTILNYQKPEIEEYCGRWLDKHLKGYTGMVNLETIDSKIIEVHLRFSDQWLDLYNKHFLQALVNLYTNKVWQAVAPSVKVTYSVVLFQDHGYKYVHPPKSIIDQILKDSDISSLQITFDEKKPTQSYSMPSGGLRLGVINCFDLQSGLRARELLSRYFRATRKIMV